MKRKYHIFFPLFLATLLVEPDAPQGPLVVSDITPNQANLSWKAPALNPEDVDNYVVEKCENGTWSKVSSAVPGTTFRVRNLKEGGDYQFRVSAENQYGLSKPITSEFVTAKHPFGKDSNLLSSAAQKIMSLA